jgi:SsrA-binding protein
LPICAAAIKQSGCSLVPLQIYFKGSWAKVLLGVAKGKTWIDRRDDIREREASWEMARAITRHGGCRREP